MFLDEFFRYLTYGELSQYNVGGIVNGEINSNNYPYVVTNINLGLIELYKRFSLKWNEIEIEVQEDTTKYTLHNNYAVSDPNNTDDNVFPKYIIDTVGIPFLNDVIDIHAIRDSEKVAYPFNDESPEVESFFLDSYNTIIAPTIEETSFFVRYKASPVLLPISGFTPETVIIPIGNQYTEALLNYTIHKIFSGISAQNPEAISFYNKFLAAVQQIKSDGLGNKDRTTTTKLEANGWL